MVTLFGLICMTIMITIITYERDTIGKKLFIKLLVLSILVSISLLVIGIL